MADEQVFMAGVFVKEPHANAPDFVLAKVSYKVEEACDFLRAHANEAGYVNSVLKRGKSGKLYMELDTWKPDPARQQGNQGQRQTTAAASPEAEAVRDTFQAERDDGETPDLPF